MKRSLKISKLSPLCEGVGMYRDKSPAKDVLGQDRGAIFGVDGGVIFGVDGGGSRWTNGLGEMVRV